MQTYAVYAPKGDAPRTPSGADSLVFVKEGFTWLAFFVPFIWLICCRAWLGLLVWFIGIVAIGVLTWFRIGAFPEFLLSVLLGLMVGFEAPWFRSLSLRRRGYRLVGAAAGASQAEAERSFFSKWAVGSEPPAQRPASPVGPVPRLNPQSVLGVFPQPEARR